MTNSRDLFAVLMLFGPLVIYVILALVLGGPGETPEPSHFLDVDG